MHLKAAGVKLDAKPIGEKAALQTHGPADGVLPPPPPRGPEGGGPETKDEAPPKQPAKEKKKGGGFFGFGKKREAQEGEGGGLKMDFVLTGGTDAYFLH